MLVVSWLIVDLKLVAIIDLKLVAVVNDAWLCDNGYGWPWRVPSGYFIKVVKIDHPHLTPGEPENLCFSWQFQVTQTKMNDICWCLVNCFYCFIRCWLVHCWLAHVCVLVAGATIIAMVTSSRHPKHDEQKCKKSLFFFVDTLAFFWETASHKAPPPLLFESTHIWTRKLQSLPNRGANWDIWKHKASIGKQRTHWICLIWNWHWRNLLSHTPLLF